MDVEHDIKMFVLDGNTNINDELVRLGSEGWATSPMIPPVAIYHMVRVKRGQTQPQPQFEGMGRATLTLDETKMGILRPKGDGSFEEIPFKVE